MRFIIYLIIINIIGFSSMGIDKYKATHHKWRISEKTLFIIALLGGSAGSIIGMQLFRHKTKHPSFFIGMPVIFFLQIAIAILQISGHGLQL